MIGKLRHGCRARLQWLLAFCSSVSLLFHHPPCPDLLSILAESAGRGRSARLDYMTLARLC